MTEEERRAERLARRERRKKERENMVDKDSSSSEDEEDPVEAEALKELEGERKLKKEVSVGLTLKARASSAMMVYPFVAQVVTLFAVFALSCVLFAAYDRSAPGVAEGDLMFALNLSSFRSRSDGYSGKLTYRAQRSFEQVDEVWDWLETVIADRVVAAEPEHRGGEGAFSSFSPCASCNGGLSKCRARTTGLSAATRP
eukprot:768335-Hanusia_phi.AAC.1